MFVLLFLSLFPKKNTSLRIMGSQNWWFGDPRPLLYTSKPLYSRVLWFLGLLFIRKRMSRCFCSANFQIILPPEVDCRHQRPTWRQRDRTALLSQRHWGQLGHTWPDDGRNSHRTSWWLNQPIWKNMSEIGLFPQGSGWTLNKFKTTTQWNWQIALFGGSYQLV